MLPLVVIPAYQAAGRVGKVVRDFGFAARAAGHTPGILVVDDGSTDGTASEAESSGARVVRHPNNQGKGAAIGTALRWAAEQGYSEIITADADGQHPSAEILHLWLLQAPPTSLVLGVRSLARDGAPRANQCSNGISNLFLSWFTGLRLRDTQCGLRRYPVHETLALDCRDPGYAFEAEVLLRAARAGLAIEQVPVVVYYPPETERLSHFHVVRDPFRIVVRVLVTLLGSP